MRILSWGIDFGTSTMRASVRTEGSVERLALGTTTTSLEERYSIPSVIRIDGDSRFTVGEGALFNADERCILSLKRLLEVRRTPYRDHFKVAGWPPKSPWELTGATVTHPRYGTFEVRALVGRMLEEVLTRSSRALVSMLALSESKTQALLREVPLMIGCSAVVGHLGRRVLSDAAREAGLSQVSIDNTVTEPTAAALSFDVGMKRAGLPANFLVIDFGAGTLDVSMVRVTEEGMSICAEHGEVLGGDDFDVRLRDLIVEKICTTTGLTPAQTYADYGGGQPYTGELRLLKLAEQCKIRLSSAEASDERIALRGSTVALTIKRGEYEDRCDELCKVLAAVLDAVLKFSKYRYDIERQNIRRVLLIGGTTRIPAVQRTIKENLPGGAFTSEAELHPIFAVAEGATQAEQIREIDAHRPPYDIEIDLVFTDNSTEKIGFSRSYDELFPLKMTLHEPCKTINPFFGRKYLRTARALFKWNSGRTMMGKELVFPKEPGKNSMFLKLFHNGRLIAGSNRPPEVTLYDEAPMYTLLPRPRNRVIEPARSYSELSEWHKGMLHTDVG